MDNINLFLLYVIGALILLIVWGQKNDLVIVDWAGLWDKIFENITFGVLMKAAVYLTLIVGPYLHIPPAILGS